MGLFDDPGKLLNTNFGWGLAPYTEEVDDDVPPPDSERLVLFVDEEGVVNIDGKVELWGDKDPINAISTPSFSKDNLFVEGLKKVINPFPTYGLLAYPITQPGSVEVLSTNSFLGPITSGGSDVRFPGSTPEGFVPCAGQILKYPGGETVVVPDLSPRQVTGGSGDGAGVSTQYFAPPGFAYLMKVPDGWKEMIPDLTGKKLSEFGTPGGGGLL
jgi:hypothetical protein